jgi:hypothetical protein
MLGRRPILFSPKATADSIVQTGLTILRIYGSVIHYEPRKTQNICLPRMLDRLLRTASG